MGNSWLVDEGVVRRIKDELRARGLDGWLLYEVQGRDPVESGDLITTFRSVWTEVNVYFGSDGPEVTTPNPQEEVFLLL